ncbi:histidine--tRNA ligase [Aquirufa ecclesiirivi]|uniref:Histidine--tRNA ligase n=1 Tax=Aquirufa ecclesiirivi TaxID=2715124 RepID=A0ABT4JF15_9BACT|nr:histidine--tRNA ligase [Aquirufa ecclesiirivi]MCZ2474161.1 histidine--tRNA ligase [Aquirufa ecclesiirivi]
MQKPSNARGTRDFGPKEMAKRNYVFNIIRKHFEQFGFQAIETPAIENLSTLTGKYGDEGDQLLFKILNSGDYLSKLTDQDFQEGSKKFTYKVSEKGLRYDLTVPFARFVSMNRNDLAFPFRRYQIQPVWRADRPQKGRYREFYQCDADIIGSNSLLNEAELITLFQAIFNSLNLKANLVINSRKVLAGVVDVLGMNKHFVDFAVAIDKLDKIGWDAVAKELIEKGFTEAQCAVLAELILFEGNNLAKIDKLTSFFNGNTQGLAGLKEIEDVLGFIQQNGFVNTNIIFDYRLARGLSYYTGLIFEGKAIDIPFGSIAGGGRYDNLTTDFGLPNMSGVGLSFGIERMIDVMDALNLFPEIPFSGSKILFAYFDEAGQTQAFQYVNELRKLGIPSEIYPEVAKIKKPFEFADKKRIPFVAVLGEQEMAQNKMNLKNMESGEQELLSLQELMEKIK